MTTEAKTLTTKGATTRARIVAAAADLAFAKGVAGMSLADVQAAAGVSSSQLYHYFGDKQDLVRAIAHHRAEEAAGYQRDYGPLDSIATLRAWAAEQVAVEHDRLCAGGCVLGSLVPQLAEPDEPARAELAAGLTHWQLAIADGLHLMADRGELADGADTDALAAALLAALQGGLVLTQARRDPRALEQALGVVIDHIETLHRPRRRRRG